MACLFLAVSSALLIKLLSLKLLTNIHEVPYGSLLSEVPSPCIDRCLGSICHWSTLALCGDVVHYLLI